MSGPTPPSVVCVIVDAIDPERLAAFWSELLHVTISHRIGPYVFLESGAGLPGIGFQRVSDAKSVKNRLHLDLACDDLAATTAHVRSLGGRATTEYAAGGFLVMADPEGNEFCLLPTDEWELDENGNAHYEHPG